MKRYVMANRPDGASDIVIKPIDSEEASRQLREKSDRRRAGG